MYSVGFPTQLLSIGCARLCEWSRLRRGGKRGPRSSRAWVTVITCELFWTQLGNWHCSERRRGAVLVLVGAHAIGDLRLQCLVAAEGKPLLVVEYPSTPQQTERLCLGRNRVVHKNHIRDFSRTRFPVPKLYQVGGHQCHALGMCRRSQA
jgi:hypothetical protein